MLVNVFECFEAEINRRVANERAQKEAEAASATAPTPIPEAVVYYVPICDWRDMGGSQ